MPDQLRKLLQARRADPTCPLAPLARRLAVEVRRRPARLAAQPAVFRRARGGPELTGGSQFGKVQVEGWIIHQEQRIRRLVASTHPAGRGWKWITAIASASTPARCSPAIRTPCASQYFGMVDIDEGQEDPVCLRVSADLEDGTRHLVFVRRFYQRGCSQLEQPLPEFGRAVFLEVALAFAAGCRAEGIRLGKWRDYWQHCRKAYRLFRQFAPTSLAQVRRGPARSLRRVAAGQRPDSAPAAAARPHRAETRRDGTSVSRCWSTPPAAVPTGCANWAASLVAQIYPPLGNLVCRRQYGARARSAAQGGGHAR
ncbi:MAG: hypothetical protein WDM96_02885 [Lacunisphaera sp.]